MTKRLIRPTALKRLKDTYRDKGVLLPHLERHVMQTPLADVRPDDHSMSFMHASDLAKADWCGRHDYYRITGTPLDREAPRNPSFRLENVLAEGHVIHEKYQRWLWEMGCLWGDWQCLDCHHRFGALSPRACQFCLSTRIIYKEVTYRHRNYMIEGHTDGVVHGLDGWDGLVEIKSIGMASLRFEAPRLYQQYLNGTSAEDIWFQIKRPFPSHLRQGMFYLWMAWPRYEQIAFLYEAKFNQSVKEFVVGYNKRFIAQRLEEASEVADAVRAGDPPPRPQWAEDAVTRICQSCEYRRTCWQLGAAHGTKDTPDPTVIVRRASTARRRRALRPA